MVSSHRIRPSWLTESQLVSVYVPDPPALTKLIGTSTTTPEADFTASLSLEALENAKAKGANLVWVPFFSGLGLEFEKELLEEITDYISQAKSIGFRIGARISVGSLIPETMLLEEAESQNWLQVNQDGQSPSIDSSSEGPRVRTCYNSEGYLRYLDRICGLALEAEVDAIHLSGLGYNPEPDTCHCPICIAVFREMLRDHYGSKEDATREAGMDRFGYNTFTHIRPPTYSREFQASSQHYIQGVHQQEWLWFKVKSVARAVERLVRFVERKTPDCAISASLPQLSSSNMAWLQGIGDLELLPLIDILTPTENAVSATDHARLSARAAAFECILHAIPEQSVHSEALGPQNDADTTNVKLASDSAFNPIGIRSLGSTASHAGNMAMLPALRNIQQTSQAFAQFQIENFTQLFSNTQSNAQILVLRDETTLAYNCTSAHKSIALLENLLLHNNLPYKQLSTLEESNISDFKVIILPDVECLSESTANMASEFVERGGQLLLIGKSGHFDQWRRHRAQPALSGLFGPAFPTEVPVHFGDGKIAYVPEIYQAENDNHQLLEMLDGMLGSRELQVTARQGRVISQLYQTTDGRKLLHILNPDPGIAVLDLQISLSMDSPPSQVVAFSVGCDPEPMTFNYDEDQKRISLAPNQLVSYSILEIQS